MPALARLNMNEIPYISWKGQTLEQITSVYKKNKKTLNSIPGKQTELRETPPNSTLTVGSCIVAAELMRAMPLPIYRREIANIQNPGCSRNSSTIASFEQPGGSIVNSNIKTKTGLVNVLDNKPSSIANATTLTSEHPDKCASNCILSPEINARRRVRSAGMNRPQFKPENNNDRTYFTSTPEYLVSRNRTIRQNTYVYFKQGTSGVQPNTGNAKSNIYQAGNTYTPAGISHCRQLIIDASKNNNYFSYSWFGVIYDVYIPDGNNYTVDSLTRVFENVMVANGHYLMDTTKSNAKVFLITIEYDTVNALVILQAQKSVNFSVDNGNNAVVYDVFGDNRTYIYPQGTTWCTRNNDIDQVDKFSINLGFYSNGNIKNNFASVLGFSSGYYIGRNVSQFYPQIAPNYVALYYKPSNIIFGIQGPVDSSTYTHRVKLNEVTRNGYLTKSAFGSATANALAYGVSEQSYTLKDKVGFKLTATPIINPDGSVCSNRKFIYRM
jgi:hypothetical protein